MSRANTKEDFSKEIKAIVENIRLVRDEKKISQDYMAAKMNISQNAYSKLELNYTKLTLRRAFEISEILEIPFTEMLKPLIEKL